MSTQPEPTTALHEPGKDSVRREKPERTMMLLYTLAYVVGGAALGFAYHKVVGCRSGACPITANPYISTIYGALVGFFVGGGLSR
jgi:hypothetical protein